MAVEAKRRGAVWQSVTKVDGPSLGAGEAGVDFCPHGPGGGLGEELPSPYGHRESMLS